MHIEPLSIDPTEKKKKKKKLCTNAPAVLIKLMIEISYASLLIRWLEM